MYTPNCTPNRPFPLKPLVAAVLLVCASGIHSAPILHHSTGKEVTVAPPVDLPVGKVTTVTQHVDRTVVDWKEFSIAEGELVKFMQLDANSVILNRVVGGDPSQILGELQANGRVFLINPNGIVFGAKSQVNVGGLVASTLSLKPGFQGNDDMLELQAETTSGEIKNLGSIHAKDIVFLAPVINNTGSLNASAAVNLIAASEVTANLGGADMVFTVKAGHENALIDQLGSVLAAGGKIVLLATASSNGADSVINTAGINQAFRISIQGDTVQLTGTFNASNSENALQVNARKINQNAALTVAGSSQMIADEVTLGHAGNDFTGQVSLNVNGAAELKDLNSLSVSGKADGLVLNAADIIQTGAVDVQNTTTLTANTVALNNAGNDFKGQVNLAISGNTNLRDANTLTVAGTSATANLNAADIAVNGLTTTGNLNIAATNTAALNNV
ncbi:MAG: filamentous hemagglutinin N-terminal domain-containing protein, partial [Limnobacter sp.]|uniref:two-partner secretion domain-containing protein n=1 Tax=Limnobacter sp. TaxID=2003368 RepID=UPI0032ED6850